MRIRPLMANYGHIFKPYNHIPNSQRKWNDEDEVEKNNTLSEWGCVAVTFGYDFLRRLMVSASIPVLQTRNHSEKDRFGDKTQIHM